MADSKKTIPTNFIVSTYGEMTQESNNLSRARMRVFYLGANRNGSFITDDFAKQMINSVYGQPIVGHYDSSLEDFTDHATKEETKPYGFVPMDLNFAWEDHTDDDGVSKKYACFDVLLWTDREENAKKILGNPQSMELNPKTVSGAWKVINGDHVFEYEKGNLWGFCVLGKNIEPCFEGSQFFALESDFKLFFEDMREFTLSQFAIERDKVAQGGIKDLENKIKLLEKYNLTQDTIDFDIKDMSIEDLQAKLDIVFPQGSTDSNKEDSNIDHSLDDDNKDPEIDLTHLNFTYKNAREVIAQAMPYSLEKNEEGIIISETSFCLMGFDHYENYAYVQRIIATAEGCEPTIGRFKYELSEDHNLATLSGEFEEVIPNWVTPADHEKNQAVEIEIVTRFAQLKEDFDRLKVELDDLKEFKTARDKEQKMAVIDSFKEILTDEDMASVIEKMDEYSLEQIDEKLSAIAFKKTAISSDHKFIYNNNNEASDGVISILQKHKKS